MSIYPPSPLSTEESWHVSTPKAASQAVHSPTVRWHYSVPSAVIANLIAIPFSAVFNRVAIDLSMQRSFGVYYKEMGHGFLRGGIQAFPHVYAGGMARTAQKIFPTLGNSYLPEDIAQKHPFSSRALIGFTAGFLSNFFKILQTQKIVDKAKYPQVSRVLLFTPSGRRQYTHNALGFATNEAWRCMALFGVSQVVYNKMGQEPHKTVSQRLLICATASSIAAFVESSVAFFGETVTAVHGSMIKGGPSIPSSPRNPIALFKGMVFFIQKYELHRSGYLYRCFSAVFVKNALANFPLVLGDHLLKERLRKESVL